MATEFQQYRTVDGDRIDLLAWEFYADPFRYQPIYEANPDYHGVATFDAGVVLKIPVLAEETTTTNASLPPWRR